MNPLIQKKIQQLGTIIEEMGETLRSNDAETKKQHAEKEAMLQEEWVRRKELTTLHRIAEDYDTLKQDLERLTEERTQIKQRTESLLRMAKSLGNAVRK